MQPTSLTIRNVAAPELDIVTELSRVLTQSTGRKGSKNEDRWGYSKGSTLKITGRHVLPVWRLLKSDANLTIYSLENVCFHVLRQRWVEGHDGCAHRLKLRTEFRDSHSPR